MSGTGREQQRGKLGGASQAADGAPRRAVEREVGQCPAHLGEAVRAHLATPESGLRPVDPPSHSPSFNADEAIRGGCARR